jgi:hypothetical protein
MRFGLSRSNRRELIAALMLAAFAVRTLVPAGFMPARDGSLALEICPDGFPAQLLHHAAHHHSGGHAHTDHCVFGGASAGAPVPHFPGLTALSVGRFAPGERWAAPTGAVRLVYLPQARGPPTAA